jgi:hypothetical protein
MQTNRTSRRRHHRHPQSGKYSFHRNGSNFKQTQIFTIEINIFEVQKCGMESKNIYIIFYIRTENPIHPFSYLHTIEKGVKSRD